MYNPQIGPNTFEDTFDKVLLSCKSCGWIRPTPAGPQEKQNNEWYCQSCKNSETRKTIKDESLKLNYGKTTLQ